MEELHDSDFNLRKGWYYQSKAIEKNIKKREEDWRKIGMLQEVDDESYSPNFRED